MNLVNEKMLPFLRKFGIKERNGLSQLATKMDSPEHLLQLLSIFQHSKHDPIGSNNRG